MKEGLLVLPSGEGQARKYLNVIGQDLNMQVEDMNTDGMRRPYRRHVQRLDEMERIIRFLFEEMTKMGLSVKKTLVDNFIAADNDKPYVLEDVEAQLKALYSQWTTLSENDARLASARNNVAEELEVVRLASSMLTGTRKTEEGALKQPLMRVVNSVAGVVSLEDQARFSRTIFRASRGNCYTHFAPCSEQMSDAKTGLKVYKTIFVVFFQGSTDSQSALRDKIVKVCQMFGVNTYEWPQSTEDAKARLRAVELEYSQRSETVKQCGDMLRREAEDLMRCPGFGRSSKLEEWRLFCIKEKSLYATLNMFEGDSHLRATVWYAARDEKKIMDTLEAARETEAAVLKPIRNSKKEPPTYIRTNELTDVWQCVINTYGVPRYQEANPALFAVVSFPFTFGMMYGDVGHGTLLTLVGAWLCWKGKALLDFPSGETLYWVRFLVLQLGIYATFAGLLYNDMFSVGLQLFDTRFGVDEDGKYFPTWDAKNEGNGKGGPYPFGVDWAWHGATNELMFMNSLKMKLSVLFGVIQMTLGVFLRFGNALYFKSKIDFFCECVPMLIFMVCFFGWMDFMILYKWVNFIDTENGPPGIINSLICMAMGPMGVGQADLFPLWEGSFTSVQLSTQLMNLAVISVPWLLIFKPFLLKREYNKSIADGAGKSVDPEDEAESGGHGHGHGGHGHGEEGFNMGEVLIHQIIETIEYVLGTVSHTASYLRIWALSLAHQQLSLVFYTKTIGMALPMSFPSNGIFLYVMFCVWFAITAAVLLGMDVLECFLHTLRLHWVEFDSKFFKADGYAFEPFSVRGVLSVDRD